MTDATIGEWLPGHTHTHTRARFIELMRKKDEEKKNVFEKGGRGGREGAETAVPAARSRLSVHVKPCGARGALPLQLAV